MNPGNKKIIKCICFLIILCTAVLSIQSVYTVDNKRSNELILDYTLEKKNSLDAVCIGGSEVHAYWQPLFGWKDYGIAVWNYSVDQLPVRSMKNLIIEARKTQPDALYIISLGVFKSASETDKIEVSHRIVDFMPYSFNKIDTIMRLTDYDHYGIEDRIDLLFPIIRFHSRWDSLKSYAYGVREVDYKASIHTKSFCEQVDDTVGEYKIYDGEETLADANQESLEELLNYCDENDVNVLFVKMPQNLDETRQRRLNQAEDMVTDRGYPCLDLIEDYDDTYLDTDNDFYNAAHTNVHGSLKVSRIIGEYLTDNYSFSDKRGQRNWKSWDDALVSYMDYLSPYVLTIETDNVQRTRMASPKLNKLQIDGQNITVSWEAVDNVDGYEIFRQNKKVWESVADINDGSLSYLDENLTASTSYTYRVVPYQTGADGSKQYGHFDVTGVKGKTKGE